MFVKKDGITLWQPKSDAKDDGTEYQNSSEHAPEHCANCEYFKRPNKCMGPNMIKLSNRPRIGKFVKVSFAAWCKFWSKKK
jgi:hypothetical protein